MIFILSQCKSCASIFFFLAHCIFIPFAENDLLLSPLLGGVAQNSLAPTQLYYSLLSFLVLFSFLHSAADLFTSLANYFFDVSQASYPCLKSLFLLLTLISCIFLILSSSIFPILLISILFPSLLPRDCASFSLPFLTQSSKKFLYLLLHVKQPSGKCLHKILLTFATLSFYFSPSFAESLFPPRIYRIEPPGGPKSGGTAVFVYGENFLPSKTYCKFGKVTQSTFPSIVTSSLVVCLSPPSIAPNPSRVQLHVTSDGGYTYSSDQISYFYSGW
jgi:hypothetical protein